VEPNSVNSWRSPIVLATLAILLLHGGLLVTSIADYRVTIDSAYHVSMGRYYGEHGLAPWDDINFGPRGRPNLQGPLLHAAIGGLGRLLGGRGDDYVLANTILAVVQWAAAMGTVAFFAYELGGEMAMLLAVALLSGAAFAGTSFAIGIPSGWLFIFTPWAIWFFLEERLLPAALAAALAIYSHLGGYVTAPLGIVMAASMARRWCQLLRCGAIIAGLTLPFTIHIIRYIGWLSGIKSHSALLFDPMLDVLAIEGMVGLFRTPREHPFMVAWLLAPIAWLFEDTGRFLLQWPLGGSVAAGWLLANKVARFADTPHRIRYAMGIAAISTLLPLGLPSLSGEIAWAAGNHYPLAVDWTSARTIARSIDQAGLAHTLITDYSPALCPALAVYADVSCEKGSWVEVQPRSDPAENVPAAQKTYIIPLAAGDSMLASLRSRGWITVYRSGAAAALSTDSSIVRLIRPPSITEAATFASATITAEAQWLGRNAINNALSYADFLRMLPASGREQFRRALAIQRAHAGRVELACVIYAWALEPGDPLQARAMRQIALKIGVIASYMSDDFALDFLSQSRFAELREEFFELATRSNRLAFDPSPSPELMANFNSLPSTTLKSSGDTFPGRPAGDWLPWLSG
jgi:hypothetical protein